MGATNLQWLVHMYLVLMALHYPDVVHMYLVLMALHYPDAI